jgi:energy-converting hydrogenase Eha subunit C
MNRLNFVVIVWDCLILFTVVVIFYATPINSIRRLTLFAQTPSMIELVFSETFTEELRHRLASELPGE